MRAQDQHWPAWVPAQMKNKAPRTGTKRLVHIFFSNAGRFGEFPFVSAGIRMQPIKIATKARHTVIPNRSSEVRCERCNAATTNGQQTAPIPQEKFNKFNAAARRSGCNLAMSRFAVGMVRPKPKP